MERGEKGKEERNSQAIQLQLQPGRSMRSAPVRFMESFVME